MSLRLRKFTKIYRFVKIYGFDRTYVKLMGRLRLNYPRRLYFSFPKRFVSVIGCGQFAFSSIAFFLTKTKGKVLLDFYDINQISKESMANYYRAGSAHDVASLLGNSQLKLLYIASNHSTHTPNEISEKFKHGNLEEDGFYIKRRFHFMGRWIKYGGYYPTILLRLFKHEKASCEREINEHIHVEGERGQLKYDFVDANNKDFTHWLDKHNSYSSFESKQFDQKHEGITNFWSTQAERKHWIRQNIWNKMMPPLIRPFFYFFYRYFLRLGFLDGKVGFIYHFMQGLVYHLLIDVKYIESKMKNKCAE